jgi:hypothetical protein
MPPKYVSQELFDERTKNLSTEMHAEFANLAEKLELIDKRGGESQTNLNQDLCQEIKNMKEEFMKLILRQDDKIASHSAWLLAGKIAGGIMLSFVTWIGVQFYAHVTHISTVTKIPYTAEQSFK